MSKSNDTKNDVASGVEELIGRLRDEGVTRGRERGEQIVQEANDKASKIVDNARQEADRILSEARSEVEALKLAGDDALKVASRDAMLALKTELAQRFTGEVKRLVGSETRKPEILRQLILEIAGEVKEEVKTSGEVEVLLPKRVLGFEELSRNPESLETGLITHFVQMMGQDMLKEGVTFGVARDNLGGLRLHLKDQEVTLDLSDVAIADVLLRHLQPRFRALLEGIVRQ